MQRGGAVRCKSFKYSKQMQKAKHLRKFGDMNGATTSVALLIDAAMIHVLSVLGVKGSVHFYHANKARYLY